MLSRVFYENQNIVIDFIFFLEWLIVVKRQMGKKIQLYHGDNKLHYNDKMVIMMSALY